MSLYTASLNSGSNGNCYYVGNHKEAVLVDAGISCREIEKRMSNLGLSMQLIKAVFISHEHVDHIRGVAVLSRKYRLPVYITSATLQNSPLQLETEICSFVSNEIISVGELSVTPFSKRHDAADPFSFTISGKDVKIGVITDIGSTCEQVIHHFKQCNAVYLESNYDEKMLDEGDYPFHLKNRIRGGNGHLSNKQALDLFLKHQPGFMSHLFLSHLSKNNNCPQLVEQLFNQHAGSVKVVVASRYQESELYTITSNGNREHTAIKRRSEQMNLFESAGMS